MKSAVDIVKSYADLKIPKSFDKDGNVKSYIQLSEKEIDEMAKNIYTIISAVPASITAIYNMFKNNGIEKDQINFINDTIQFSSAGIMDGSKVLVEKYAEIKKELKDGNEIKKTLGAFLLNIGRMYVDFLDLFKKAGYVPDDIKAVYEYLEVIISKKTIYQIKDIAEGLVTISELMHSIKESVVDNIIMDSAKITLAWKPDFTIIATDINNIIEGVKQVIDLIDNTVDSRDFRRTIRNSRSALDYLDSVKQQYSNCIEQIINIVNDSILITDSVAKYALDSDNDTVKGKIEKIVSTTYDIISSLNSVINENDNKVDLSKKMQRKFNALSDSFHGYEESMKTISQTFNEIIKTFGPNTSSISDFIMVKHSIGTAINTIMDISRMIDNPDQIDEVLNGENGNRKSRFEMLKEKVTKKSIKSIFGDFAQMSNDFSRSIEDLVNAFTKTQSLEEASFYNMDFLLWIIQEHSKTITESQVEKLEKESESIERYTKAIDKVSVSKLNTLIRLFQAMDKWAHSVGNLDEFTRALSDELASSLQQLTSEINEAKDVIKKADEQRKERQKQLDESIEKVGKLMNQTLHVNVSSGSDDTIGAAYENPRD